MQDSTLKNIIKIAIGLGFLIPLTKSERTLALDACATTDTVTTMAAESNPCFFTPEMLKVKFYEIGFCTSDPLASGTFDNSTCYKSWENTSGFTSDIGQQTYEKMSGKTYRVPNGTYGHAYAIMNNTWTYKGKYKLEDGDTFYTRSDGGVTTEEGSYAEWTDDISDMLGEESTGLCYDYSANTSDGTLTAVLADSSNATATGTSTCESATRVIGSIAMNNSVTMTDFVTGYRLTWKISNLGIGLTHFNNGSNQVPNGFRGGPFTPQFGLIRTGLTGDV